MDKWRFFYESRKMRVTYVWGRKFFPINRKKGSPRAIHLGVVPISDNEQESRIILPSNYLQIVEEFYVDAKSRMAVSSGNSENMISSWTAPPERTPPPMIQLAKSAFNTAPAASSMLAPRSWITTGCSVEHFRYSPKSGPVSLLRMMATREKRNVRERLSMCKLCGVDDDDMASFLSFCCCREKYSMNISSLATSGQSRRPEESDGAEATDVGPGLGAGGYWA